MLNTEELKKFARLYLARKKLREKDKDLTDKLMSMQPGLLENLASEEIDKFNFKGGITVSIKSQIWPKYGDRQKVIQALKEADGLSIMIEEGFNTNTLAAYLRGLGGEKQEISKILENLPEPLKGVIEPNEVFFLRAKKTK